MFDFFKRKRKHRSPRAIPQHLVEFERRRRELYEKRSIEDTGYDELLEAMSAIEHEMNHVGGGNWNAGDYSQYLKIVQSYLTSDPQFSPAQRKSIGWALDEIASCGDELETDGKSSRDMEEPIDYLIARVIDWCRTHEPESRG